MLFAILKILKLLGAAALVSTVLIIFNEMSVNSESYINTMQAVTMSYIDKADICVSLAMSLASLFAIIHVLKLSYDIMSPGGSRFELKSLLRPVVIVFAISAYPTIIGGVYNISNRFTSRAQDKDLVVLTQAQANDEMRNYKADKQEELRQTIINAKTDLENARNANDRQGVKDARQSLKKAEKDLRITGRPPKGQRLEWWLAQIAQSHDPNVSTESFDTPSIDLTGFGHNVIKFVYTVFMIFVNIQLSIMSVLGVFALAFSMLDIWKRAFITFLSKYIELFMWGVVASFVLEISNVAQAVIIKEDYKLMLDGESEGTGLMLVLVVASIVAILNVPKIASSILNIATPEDFGYSTAAMTPVKALKGAASSITN